MLVRSAYLKGALTEKARWLPDELAPLRRAVDTLVRATNTTYAELPTLAMRYCLGAEGVSSVLVGARTSSELDVAIDAAATPLTEAQRCSIEEVAIEDERLLNPSTWPIP